MKLEEFIGKAVISTATKHRFLLYEITSPEIKVVTATPDEEGHHSFYSWSTINGEPFSTGRLSFEDASLLKPFREAYDAYCRTKDAYWEEYGYWMRKD